MTGNLEVNTQGKPCARKPARTVWKGSERTGRKTVPRSQTTLHALASRGSFLLDEATSDWARKRRREVQDHTRQSVHALTRLLLKRYGEVAEEEVLRILLAYRRSHPADEDLVRPLLHLLAKRGRYNEALDYYELLERGLEARGLDKNGQVRTPHRLTEEIVKYARLKLREGRQVPRPEASDLTISLESKPIPQEPGHSLFARVSSLSSVLEESSANTSSQAMTHALEQVASFFSQEHRSLPLLSVAIKQGLLEAFSELEGTAHMNPSRRHLLQQILQIAGVTVIANAGSLEHVLFDPSQSIAEAQMAPETLELKPLYSRESLTLDEKTLSKFEKITANCWTLLRSDGLLAVEQLLPTYLPQIAAFAQQTSPYQKWAASIVSQGYVLAGLVAVLKTQATQSEKYCEKAVLFARIAKDRNLEAASLKHLATKYLNNGRPLEALQTYQEVLPFINEVSPLLQGRTYLGLALAHARLKQEKEAYYSLGQAHALFPDHPEQDVSFAYADCGRSSLNHYTGLIYTEFGQLEQARETFAEAETLASKVVVPERTRIEILNCQADASLTLGDRKTARDLIEKSVIGARRLESGKRLNEARGLYTQARRLWPNESPIKDLADLFIL